MLVHFYTLPHLMVTIETDDQTGLVATKAVSVSKSELENKKDFICSAETERNTQQLVLANPGTQSIIRTYEYELSFCQ